MGYTIKNSTAKNNYFTAGGTAIGTTTQPNIKGSTIAGVLDSSIPTKDTGLVPASDERRAYTGHDNVSILECISNNLQGVAGNTTLRSPGIVAGQRQSIRKVNDLRTNKVGMAVRAGYWNEYSGRFQTSGGKIYPDTADDITAVGVDSEAIVKRSLGGAHSYNYGANVATGLRYPARTQ